MTIGALSAINYPFGVGGGGFASVAEKMNREYRLRRVFERAREDAVTGVLNAYGLYLAELGFVFANYDDRVPQIEYEVDRDKVKRHLHRISHAPDRTRAHPSCPR